MGNFTSLHERRKQRNRTSLKKKSKGMLRLTVFRSSKHIYLLWELVLKDTEVFSTSVL